MIRHLRVAHSRASEGFQVAFEHEPKASRMGQKAHHKVAYPWKVPARTR